MLHKTVAALAASIFLGTTVAMASTSVVPTPVAPTKMRHHVSPSSAILRANNEVGIAVTGNLINYQEHVPASYGPSDTESGWTPGFNLKAISMGNLGGIPNLYGQVNLTYDSGSIAYKGAVLYRPYDDTDRSTMYRVVGRLGKGFFLSPNAMVTPYLALGYQHWNRDLVGPYGYVEDYSAFLFGIGAKGQYALTNRLVLGAHAEFLAVVNGHMTPKIRGLGNILGTSQFGMSGEEDVGLNVDYRIDGPVHLFGGLNYIHYNYTGGLFNFGAFEPFSATNLFRVEAGVAYSF